MKDSNLGIIHSGCADARKNEFQTKWKDITLKPGDHVKFPLKGTNGVEHIWLEITSAGQEEIKGKLANDPVNPEFKHGDEHVINKSEIEDFLV